MLIMFVHLFRFWSTFDITELDLKQDLNPRLN